MKHTASRVGPVVLSTLLLGACAATSTEGPRGPAAGTASKATIPVETTSPKPAAHVSFIWEGPGEGGEGAARITTDVVTAPGQGANITTNLYGDADSTAPGEVLRLIWDGSRLLSYGSMADPKYTLYEAPDEHPDAWAGMGLWTRDLMGVTTGTTCQKINRHRTVLSRETDGYRCTIAASEMQEAHTDTYWFDSQTGALLETTGLRARSFKLVPNVSPRTFDTQAPAGSHPVVLAARKPGKGGVTVPQFTLERLAGGTIERTSLSGHPYVIVFFSSDLSWDLPDSCTGCLAALQSLQRMTKNGTDPVVLAVQVGSRGKPGYPFPTPAVHLPMANAPDGGLQHALGFANQFAMAFVGADGKVKAGFDRAPTDDELGQGLARIG
jgi:hypothetical protein